MESVIKGLKKGHKVAITTAINKLCRNYVFSNGWDIDEDVIEEIVRHVNFEYFVMVNREQLQSNEEREIFQREIRDKVIRGFEDFATKEPTLKQIYYYVNLCLDNGEFPKMIMTNKGIFIEINRLKE